jgi:hypothetical protein
MRRNCQYILCFWRRYGTRLGECGSRPWMRFNLFLCSGTFILHGHTWSLSESVLCDMRVSAVLSYKRFIRLMRTFLVEKMDIKPQKEIVRRFPIKGGEVCPRVSCTMDLVLSATIMLGRNMRGKTSLSRSVIKGRNFVVRFVEAER